MDKFNIITTIIDWVENKVKTKTGCIIIGILVGSISPLSYIYFQQHEFDLLNSKIEELKIDLKAQKELTADWRQRAIDADNNCMEKMKQMMLFFNQLEDSYNKKRSEQEKMLKQLTNNLKVANKLNK